LELNWSTFVFEIINFLVLIWIMKRFFYKPVLGVIERRRKAIDEKLADAESLHTEGSKLKAHYEERLGNWEKERQQARDILLVDVAEERSRMMGELDTALEQEREKARVGEERRIQEQFNRAEEQALRNGSLFVTRLLDQIASLDLEVRLIDIFLKEFGALPSERIDSLRRGWGEGPVKATLVSAYPLMPEQQQQLINAMDDITEKQAVLEFEQDPELFAGLRITINGWVLGLNLRDELRGFSELGSERASDI